MIFLMVSAFCFASLALILICSATGKSFLKMSFLILKLSRTLAELSTLLVVLSCVTPPRAQTDRPVITYNSESITNASIVYGIEKGFYRNEGINLEFRFLRSDLAAAAISGGEIDYMISAGTAFRAA